MLKNIGIVFVFSLVLVRLPAMAQANADASAELAGCGPVNLKFEVKTAIGANPAQPEPGKALVFFIERDININIVTPVSYTHLDVYKRQALFFTDGSTPTAPFWA